MSAGTVAISGVDGFIGRNLSLRLQEHDYDVIGLVRDSAASDWVDAVERADALVHLAGANRPEDPADFEAINRGSAESAVRAMTDARRAIPVIYTSSTRAADDDVYGASKRAGEEVFEEHARRTGSPLVIFRLPNVFGKWARPNYNSAVATFCHNIARDLPIEVHDPAAELRLVYIDDVVAAVIDAIERPGPSGFREVEPVYRTTVGLVADTIRGFRSDRDHNLIGPVGEGLERALYATYVAALPPERFSYPIESHSDPRGSFSEVLKTRTSGQFSFFTAHPGVTRGGHYHHTKTEKFLIVHGRARFSFRHMLTGEKHEIITSGDEPRVVETVPGWTHDVTNIGEGQMISLLWANELFDRERPDTISAPLDEPGAAT